MLKITVKPSGFPVVRKVKAAAAGMLTTAACLAAPIAAYAAEEGTDTGIFETVSASMLTAIQGMVTSLGSLIGSIIPIALPIVGVGMVVTIGLSIFKKVTGKA